MTERTWWWNSCPSGEVEISRWKHPTAGMVVTVYTVSSFFDYKVMAPVTRSSSKTYKLKANGRAYDTEWEIPV